MISSVRRLARVRFPLFFLQCSHQFRIRDRLSFEFVRCRNAFSAVQPHIPRFFLPRCFVYFLTCGARLCPRVLRVRSQVHCSAGLGFDSVSNWLSKARCCSRIGKETVFFPPREKLHRSHLTAPHFHRNRQPGVFRRTHASFKLSDALDSLRAEYRSVADLPTWNWKSKVPPTSAILRGYLDKGTTRSSAVQGPRGRAHCINHREQRNRSLSVPSHCLERRPRSSCTFFIASSALLVRARLARARHMLCARTAHRRHALRSVGRRSDAAVHLCRGTNTSAQQPRAKESRDRCVCIQGEYWLSVHGRLGPMEGGDRYRILGVRACRPLCGCNVSGLSNCFFLGRPKTPPDGCVVCLSLSCRRHWSSSSFSCSSSMK